MFRCYLHVKWFLLQNMLIYHCGEFREALFFMSVNNGLPGPTFRRQVDTHHRDCVLQYQLSYVSLHWREKCTVYQQVLEKYCNYYTIGMGGYVCSWTMCFKLIVKVILKIKFFCSNNSFVSFALFALNCCMPIFTYTAYYDYDMCKWNFKVCLLMIVVLILYYELIF